MNDFVLKAINNKVGKGINLLYLHSYEFSESNMIEFTVSNKVEYWFKIDYNRTNIFFNILIQEGKGDLDELIVGVKKVVDKFDRLCTSILMDDHINFIMYNIQAKYNYKVKDICNFNGIEQFRELVLNYINELRTVGSSSFLELYTECLESFVPKHTNEKKWF